MKPAYLHSLFALGLAIGLAGVGALSSPASAAGPAFCTQYAATAVAQQGRNRALGCGYRGPRWHSRWQLHFNWCLGVPAWQANRETRVRRQRLRACRSGWMPPVPGPRLRTFTRPRIGGMRLDWCRRFGSQCGRPAANAFCRSRGYRYAVSYAKANNIGRWTPTRVIGSGAVCAADYCDGFRYITCRR